jgi:hypothetical protein
MSRKHYVRTAEILKGVEDYDDRRRLAREFAVMFKADNSHFDYGRFMAACGVEVW